MTFDLFNQPAYKSFHNTIGLSDSDLEEAEATCNRQEERIMKIFQGVSKQVDAKMTPIAVHKIYEAAYGETPLTSIRRAMTNLTVQGKLKRGDMKLEKYGKPNYQWELV